MKNLEIHHRLCQKVRMAQLADVLLYLQTERHKSLFRKIMAKEKEENIKNEAAKAEKTEKTGEMLLDGHWKIPKRAM